MVKLNKINPYKDIEILIKLEMYNPGGSIKDRIAKNIIETAEAEKKLRKGSTIIEPTSGNTGIGLALIAAQKGYRTILVMPDTMSNERRQLLKAFGAELILTPGKKGMKGAVQKAEELLEKNNDYFMARQFSNPANPAAHSKYTAQEIIADTEKDLDYFIAGVGTGGTLTGIGKVLKNRDNNIKIVAVEPENSAVISGEDAGSHKIQGIGAGFIPEVLNQNIIDKIIKISDKKALSTTKKLAQKEGILAGISAGANTAAALLMAKELKENNKVDSRIVTIAPDTGERYLSTTLFE